MTEGIPSAWMKINSLNSHNFIITSTAAGWTWLFPTEQICFAFRTIWSGQDEIFMILLLISSHSSFILFKANILWGKDNFFQDQKISSYLCLLFHLKAWLLRKGLHWKRKRAEQVIRIWGGSKTCLHFQLNQIWLYAICIIYNRSYIKYVCWTMGTFFRFGWWELGSQANMQLLWPWPTGNRFDIWQEMTKSDIEGNSFTELQLCSQWKFHSKCVKCVKCVIWNVKKRNMYVKFNFFRQNLTVSVKTNYAMPWMKIIWLCF